MCIRCHSRRSLDRTAGAVRRPPLRRDDLSISVLHRRLSDARLPVCRSRDAAGPCPTVRRRPTTAPLKSGRRTVSDSARAETPLRIRERFSLGSTKSNAMRHAVISAKYSSISRLVMMWGVQLTTEVGLRRLLLPFARHHRPVSTASPAVRRPAAAAQ